MKQPTIRGLRTATILSIIALVIFVACFIYAHWFGYSEGKISSSILVVGGIIILVKNSLAYKKIKAKKENIDS